MAKEYRHLRVLREQLEKAVATDVKEQILSGMDYIREGSSPEVKAKWAYELMERMNRLLDADTCIKVREKCACVLSNENSIYAKGFRRIRRQYPDDHEYLREVVAYLNSTKPLRRCGAVSLEGTDIHSVIGRGACACPVIAKGLGQLDHPMPRTWCHCCKGSLLSVYEHVFPGRMCEMEIAATVASGADECRFITRYR
ncbi:MAG TPA: hypothetical protein GXX29_10865 [Firmicutes bacterium]|nr:hypothetical protein [Bacillota bacterium]